ncbi:hypothetical protein FUAX_26850 [Fulvitalea axinellae]|uniref:Uncharacterized protein n=1 Tax=Fulvitalea axinellae TaxID=1182444 RepID=A0AAU9D2S0_9BACT|nr:hypothetical protein FUAX_26850 [Fulvitalea axinellae]
MNYSSKKASPWLLIVFSFFVLFGTSCKDDDEVGVQIEVRQTSPNTLSVKNTGIATFGGGFIMAFDHAGSYVKALPIVKPDAVILLPLDSFLITTERGDPGYVFKDITFKWHMPFEFFAIRTEIADGRGSRTTFESNITETVTDEKISISYDKESIKVRNNFSYPISDVVVLIHGKNNIDYVSEPAFLFPGKETIVKPKELTKIEFKKKDTPLKNEKFDEETYSWIHIRAYKPDGKMVTKSIDPTW